jgi:predicted dehydrogenase
VVHVTTPARTHFRLAMDVIGFGRHILVEKPATTNYDEFLELKREAQARGCWLMEDQNYRFNGPVQALLALVAAGHAGELRHVEIHFCANLAGPGSPFVDRGCPHPSLAEPGGAVSDFLPHFAYLCNMFAGPHRKTWRHYGRRLSTPMPYDEFMAGVEGERATATIYFSASAQPNAFQVRVYGTRLTAEADLFEPRLAVWLQADGMAGLQPFKSSFRQAAGLIKSGLVGLKIRLAGEQPAMTGLGELIRRIYSALETGGPPPVTLEEVEACVRLTGELQRITGERT